MTALFFTQKENYFLLASKDALRNSLASFSNIKESLRARVPAALFCFPIEA